MRCSNGIFTVESAFFGGKNANELSSYTIAIQNKWSIYIQSASNREKEREAIQFISVIGNIWKIIRHKWRSALVHIITIQIFIWLVVQIIYSFNLCRFLLGFVSIVVNVVCKMILFHAYAILYTCWSVRMALVSSSMLNKLRTNWKCNRLLVWFLFSGFAWSPTKERQESIYFTFPCNRITNKLLQNMSFVFVSKGDQI